MERTSTSRLVMLAACTALGLALSGTARVSAQEGSPTLQDCAEQQDSCLRENNLLGLFTCPLQFNQCVLEVATGIPGAVAAAIGDARACARAANRCRASAESPDALVDCAAREAVCLGGVLNTDVPKIVTGTVECVTAAESCVLESRSQRDLAACAATLATCAADQAVSVLPEDVGAVIKSVNACVSAVASCTADANTAVELADCAQTEARCVAMALGVDAPPVVDAAVDCAEAAVDCTLDANTPAGVARCGVELAQCNRDIILN